MEDEETINSVLERLITVRKTGIENVVELTRRRQEMFTTQLVVPNLYNTLRSFSSEQMH